MFGKLYQCKVFQSTTLISKTPFTPTYLFDDFKYWNPIII